MQEVSAWCDLCADYPRGGRYDFNRDCCRARFLANAPRYLRQAFYEKIAHDEGKRAALAMVAKVNEWHRQRAETKLGGNDGTLQGRKEG